MRNNANAGVTVVIVLSIIVGIVSAISLYVIPLPKADQAKAKFQVERDKLIDSATLARHESDTMALEARKRVWEGDSEAVTSSIISMVTTEAESRQLRLAGVRSQRPQSLDSVTELPFSVQITGRYPSTVALLQWLDQPGHRVALKSVQLASSDGATDDVTCTVAFSAYLPATAAPAVNTKKGGSGNG